MFVLLFFFFFFFYFYSISPSSSKYLSDTVPLRFTSIPKYNFSLFLLFMFPVIGLLLLLSVLLLFLCSSLSLGKIKRTYFNRMNSGEKVLVFGLCDLKHTHIHSDYLWLSQLKCVKDLVEDLVTYVPCVLMCKC